MRIFGGTCATTLQPCPQGCVLGGVSSVPSLFNLVLWALFSQIIHFCKTSSLHSVTMGTTPLAQAALHSSELTLEHLKLEIAYSHLIAETCGPAVGYCGFPRQPRAALNPQPRLFSWHRAVFVAAGLWGYTPCYIRGSAGKVCFILLLEVADSGFLCVLSSHPLCYLQEVCQSTNL